LWWRLKLADLDNGQPVEVQDDDHGFIIVGNAVEQAGCEAYF